MARKKASLGTPQRRPPTLRAASAGFAAAGARQRVAHGKVRRPAPIAEPVAGITIPQTATALPYHVEAADRDAIETKLVELVGPHKRVLVIGRDTWPLSRSLSGAGCRVSVVETRHDVPAGSATFSDRVVVGDPDALELDATFEGAQFDAVVVVQLLEYVRHPVRMLTTLRKHLAADGCVVAAVPNIMHGSIRVGFLTGRSPAVLLSSDGTSPSHWFDRTAVERTFERAGFVVTRLERHTEAFDSGAALLDGTPLPAEIVGGLMRDADAMTCAFVAVAHPFPLTGRVLLEIRVRELAQAHDTLLQRLQELAQRAEGLDTRFAELQRAFDGAVWKVDRIAADLQSIAAGDSRLQASLAAAQQRLMGECADLAAIDKDLQRFQYEQLILRVRSTVEATVPKGAVVLVVSKGDQRLLDFHLRTGWHFLRNDDGVYAGHHPADSAAAIAALERMRTGGAEYLVVPQVALWWLDHYAAFREHLDRRCRVIARDDRTGVIYSLDPSIASGSSRAKSRDATAETGR